jgi:hypothetical protein
VPTPQFPQGVVKNQVTTTQAIGYERERLSLETQSLKNEQKACLPFILEGDIISPFKAIRKPAHV